MIRNIILNLKRYNLNFVCFYTHVTDVRILNCNADRYVQTAASLPPASPKNVGEASRRGVCITKL